MNRRQQKPAPTEYIPTEFGRAYVMGQDSTRLGTFVPTAFVDICGGQESDAKIFGQIMYWYVPDRHGQSKLSQFSEGFWWLAKNHGEWFEETRTKYQTVRKCLDRLRDEHHLIYVVLKGFKGSPTPYIRVNWEEFERRVNRWMELKGADTPEKEYRNLLRRLATPSRLVDAYGQLQDYYDTLSKELFTSGKKEQTPVIKYQTIDLLDHTPLIRRIRPLLKRIKSNTETTTKTTIQRLPESTRAIRARAQLIKHPAISGVCLKRLADAVSSASPLPAPRSNVPHPPLPPPPLPPAASKPEAAGAGEGQGKPPEAATMQDAVARLTAHPLWQAYAAAFPLHATPMILPRDVEEVETVLRSLENEQPPLTPEEVSATMREWLPKRKTKKPHNFRYLLRDARMYRHVNPPKGAMLAGGTGAPISADDDLATVEGCERILADPLLPPFLHTTARKALAMLRPTPIPDDFYPALQPGETAAHYFQRRAELWADIAVTGYVNNYVSGTLPAALDGIDAVELAVG